MTIQLLKQSSNTGLLNIIMKLPKFLILKWDHSKKIKRMTRRLIVSSNRYSDCTEKYFQHFFYSLTLYNNTYTIINNFIGK